MAEVTEYGYSTLRNFIQGSWKYVELQDETSTPIIRLGIGDSRVSWLTHDEGANILKLQVVISGADVTLPKTFAKTVIYDVASGGEVIASADIEITTLTQVIDELTVVSVFKVPTVATVEETPTDEGLVS